MISASGLRKLHNSLNLAIGLQILIWVPTGCYMVLMDINFIRGQQFIDESKPLLPSSSVINITPAELQQRYGQLDSLSLIPFDGGAAYIVKQGGNRRLYSATTGEPLAPLLTDEQARSIAIRLFAGDGEISDTQLHLESLPDEIGWAKAPIWQVTFTGMGEPRLYLSASTGELVTKRHDFWQVFDFFWMLHIMDYDTRENIHNLLLRIVASLALVSALSGVLLLWFGRRRKA